jgi:hypothetical protein
MLGQQKMSECANAGYCNTKAASNYQAPKLNLEHIVFGYCERMKPGSFKTMVKLMAEHMDAMLKYGGLEASKAIKRAENPVYKKPDKTTRDVATRKALMLFDRKFEQPMKKEETWKENLGKSFKKLTSHCVPSMKTKLCGMEGWTNIEESQDGIKMVKLLHRVYFDTDGSKQSMREIVLADKKLFLCFHKKEWSLDKYTIEFIAREEVCEEIKSTPGKCLESAQLAASADR